MSVWLETTCKVADSWAYIGAIREIEKHTGRELDGLTDKQTGIQTDRLRDIDRPALVSLYIERH